MRDHFWHFSATGAAISPLAVLHSTNSQSAARILIINSTVPNLKRLCATAAAKRPTQHADVVPLLVQGLYSPHNAQECRLPASCFTEGINEAAFYIRIRAAAQFGLPAQVWT